jgi:hypothetical protein
MSTEHVQLGHRQSYASNRRAISPVLMWHWGQVRLPTEPTAFWTLP